VQIKVPSFVYFYLSVITHSFVTMDMGGATIETGGSMSPTLQRWGGRDVKIIVHILYACNTKYTLHVYSMRYFTFCRYSYTMMTFPALGQSFLLVQRVQLVACLLYCGFIVLLSVCPFCQCLSCSYVPAVIMGLASGGASPSRQPGHC